MLLSIFPWESTSTDTFHPLTYIQFLTFVLVPYIATELITEDMHCSLEAAHHCMIQSHHTGTILHPEHDNDDEVDTICRSTLAAFKSMRLKTKGKQRESNIDVMVDDDDGTKAAVAALLELKKVLFR